MHEEDPAVMQPRVLLVDDDPAFAQTLRLGLSSSGLGLAWASSVDEARAALASSAPPDLLLLDIDLGEESGLDFLVELSGRAPSLPVVMLTGSRRFEDAQRALRHGANDYLVKPLSIGELRMVVQRLLDQAEARRELHARRLLDPEGAIEAGSAVFASAAMKAALARLERIKDSSAPVLLTGETGTGKEVLARWLHEHGSRRRGPFIDVNCASLPTDLAESALFGHEPGAFTGASERNIGYFERAHGGILFLDEVGELGSALQSKLLRVLQGGEFDRVGGARVRVDVRLVAATNRDLAREVAEGRFREDLFYRLEVLVIRVPPLRDRPDDVLHLAERFLREAAAREGGPPKRLGASARIRLMEHTWPGNVRELKNGITRAYLMGSGAEVEADDLELGESSGGTEPPHRGVDDSARREMLEALARCRGNVSAASRALGIGRATFYRRAKRLDLDL